MPIKFLLLSNEDDWLINQAIVTDKLSYFLFIVHSVARFVAQQTDVAESAL